MPRKTWFYLVRFLTPLASSAEFRGKLRKLGRQFLEERLGSARTVQQCLWIYNHSALNCIKRRALQRALELAVTPRDYRQIYQLVREEKEFRAFANKAREAQARFLQRSLRLK